MHTKKSLKRDLAAMGLAPEQTVLIHSSMKSIGEVEGGADIVLDALQEYFAPGLLVFPTLTWDCVDAAHPVFSVNDTPGCVGILAELFRKRPGVKRSLSPTHSVAAYGKDAEVFVAGHERFDSPAHPDSPWGKLYHRNAVILFIGTGIACNTYLHGVEEWLPVPGMLTDQQEQLVIIDEKGKRIPRPMRRHVGAHSHWYSLMEQPFRDQGALRDGTLGDAHVHLVDARKAGDIVFELLKKHPLFFTEEFQETAQKL
ncbi:MAG: AAC(3) family N-acetyltransferase [Lentisphaeria bacterium]|nr:AAC(3) family N-acetyltransferase [Lentisphaeria bacterium]